MVLGRLGQPLTSSGMSRQVMEGGAPRPASAGPREFIVSRVTGDEGEGSVTFRTLNLVHQTKQERGSSRRSG